MHFPKKRKYITYDCLWISGSYDLDTCEYRPFYGVIADSLERLETFCTEVLEEEGYKKPYKMISFHRISSEMRIE